MHSTVVTRDEGEKVSDNCFIIDIYIYLGLPIQKDMIGGVRDTLVNELHVMPLLIRPSLLVTTTTKIKVSFDLYY